MENVFLVPFIGDKPVKVAIYVCNNVLIDTLPVAVTGNELKTVSCRGSKLRGNPGKPDTILKGAFTLGKNVLRDLLDNATYIAAVIQPKCLENR